MNYNDRLIRLRELSRKLRISADWLRRESDAGRIPHLKVGRQRLYHLDAVEQALVQRASQEKEVNPNA